MALVLDSRQNSSTIASLSRPLSVPQSTKIWCSQQSSDTFETITSRLVRVNEVLE